MGGALAEALHAIPDGMIYIKDEVRIEFINASACRLFGWKPQELDKATLNDVRAQGVGARVIQLIRAALKSAGAFEPRVDLLETDDAEGRSKSSYRVSIVPLRDPSGSADGTRFADVLSSDLTLSGYFRVLDRDAYIDDPQLSGLEVGEIEFLNWSTIGALAPSTEASRR